MKGTYTGFLIGCFCLIVLAGNTLQAQDTLVNQFRNYTANAFTEKVFLHTDRNFYLSGEIMWFKIYLTSLPDNKPSGMSKVVYAEVLDELNRPVLQSKIGMREGRGEGSFFLSTAFPSGVYKLRAYTGWMKNFDAAYFFEKEITVVNASTPLPFNTVDSSAIYDISFLPEGGRLVNGIPSVVAFKLTDNHGQSVDNFTGIIVDKKADTITTFSPYKFGMGRFSLTPAADSGPYTAYITTSSGQHFAKELPLADAAGYTLQLQDAGQKIRLVVKASSLDTRYMYTLIHTRGVVKEANRLELRNGLAEVVIEKERLGDGISHITLFDATRRAVCERLYFGSRPTPLPIQAKTEATQYEKRSKVTLTVKATDSTNLSLAVYRSDSLQIKDPFDIYSYLWLSSDLKGRIESPDWYFTGNKDSTTYAMDNLMLTQGWRRFDWRNIRQNTKPDFDFLPEIEGHIVTGKITDAASGKPIPKSLAFLSFPGTQAKFYTAEADKNGLLTFYTKDVYGQGELVTEADNTMGAPYNIEIQPPYANAFTPSSLPPFYLSPQLGNALQNNSINAQVVRKFGSDRLKELIYPAVVDTTRFYGKADETYLLDNYTRFTTMEEVLREYILGVLVGVSGKNYRLRVIDLLSNTIMRDNPLVLLDGVPVLKMNSIIAYDPLKVRKLDVVKGKYYYGAAVFSGIVDFTTYKGNMENYEMNPEAIVFDYDGLQLRREFYSPQYDTQEEQRNTLADYRNLLYWNPEVVITKEGLTEVSFYTSDLSGSYKGVLQGIAIDGKSGSAEFLFSVK